MVQRRRDLHRRKLLAESALDPTVRAFPLGPFLEEMQILLDRGATQFKFVDRTFNLNLGTSKRILEFCLDHHKPGMLFHFEMIPAGQSEEAFARLLAEGDQIHDLAAFFDQYEMDLSGPPLD